MVRQLSGQDRQTLAALDAADRIGNLFVEALSALPKSKN